MKEEIGLDFDPLNENGRFVAPVQKAETMKTEKNTADVIQLDAEFDEQVSPMLFGSNIEHTRSCVWNGLSAQMLRNRKFVGKPSACRGCAAQWYPIGEHTFFQFDKPYTRHHELYHMKRNHECNSQRILNAADGRLSGLGQHELFLQEGRSYHFRIVARTSQPVPVTAALTSRHGKDQYASSELRIEGNEWKTYEAVLVSKATDEDADLRITFTQQASLCVGAVSLMPSDHFRGMRRDVIACLKEIGIRLLRWPGGNFAGEYNWLDGLLPADMRAPFESCLGIETQPHTMGYDFHEINTDDFIALCRETGAEPFITINPCWNTAEESAAWVEYCNGDAQTPYGKLRTERGHPQPYQVRLWSLGNEFGYGHMEGENTAEGYCRIALENAKAMQEVCADLRLCSSGPYPNAEWAQKSASALRDRVGLASQHFYAHKPEYPDAVCFAPEYERCLADVKVLREQLHQNRACLPEDVKISMDEWNVWYAWYRPSSVTDGVFAALTMHMLMTEAKDCLIEQACHFEAVNEGLLEAAPTGARLTAQGQVFSLTKHHIGGAIRHKGLDAFVTSREGVLTLTAVNASYDQPRTLAVVHQGKIIFAKLYGSDSVIPPSRFEERTLRMKKTSDGYQCTMPPHSVMLIQLSDMPE